MTEFSPVGYDENEQAAVHDELKEFLGSDDESESDSEASFLATEPTTPGKKRKREDLGESEGEEQEGEEGDEDEAHGSRLSQKIKRSHERTTGLKTVANADTTDSSETPAAADEDGEGDGGTEDQDAGGEGNEAGYSIEVNPEEEDDELEREMLAAFEDGDYDEKAEEDVAAENG